MTKKRPVREKKDMGGTLRQRAGEIRICDPACGTMNFGLAAIDMLREIYREEIDQAGKPGWPGCDQCSSENEIDGKIVRNNLIGFDIDPLAIDLARQSIEIKIGRAIAREIINSS